MLASQHCCQEQYFGHGFERLTNAPILIFPVNTTMPACACFQMYPSGRWIRLLFTSVSKSSISKMHPSKKRFFKLIPTSVDIVLSTLTGLSLQKLLVKVDNCFPSNDILRCEPTAQASKAFSIIWTLNLAINVMVMKVRLFSTMTARTKYSLSSDAVK